MSTTGTTAPGTDATKPPRKPRAPKAGKVVSFRISDEEYAKLQAAAEADMRTPDNLAFVATKKYIAGLGGSSTTSAAAK